MRKDVLVTIGQKPISALFTCPYCDIDFEVSYEEFENMVNSDLTGILYDNPSFKCPECDELLGVGEAELD